MTHAADLGVGRSGAAAAGCPPDIGACQRLLPVEPVLPPSVHRGRQRRSRRCWSSRCPWSRCRCCRCRCCRVGAPGRCCRCRCCRCRWPVSCCRCRWTLSCCRWRWWCRRLRRRTRAQLELVERRVRAQLCRCVPIVPPARRCTRRVCLQVRISDEVRVRFEGGPVAVSSGETLHEAFDAADVTATRGSHVVGVLRKNEVPRRQPSTIVGRARLGLLDASVGEARWFSLR